MEMGELLSDSGYGGRCITSYANLVGYMSV